MLDIANVMDNDGLLQYLTLALFTLSAYSVKCIIWVDDVGFGYSDNFVLEKNICQVYLVEIVFI